MQSKFYRASTLGRLAHLFASAPIFRSCLLSALLGLAAFGQTCTFTVNPGPNVYVDANGVIDLAGDPLVIQVTASAQSCAWSVDQTDGFATVASSTGNPGNGSVTYSIPVNNTGAARTTKLSIAGNTVTLKQDATAVKFADALPNGPEHNFFDGINLLAQKGITAGVGTNSQGQPLYGPSENVTRGQMAVFIIATIFSSSGDNFTYSPTPYFTDVPASSPIFKFVQKMRDLGIAAGQTATTYGPNLPVTREQMAVFITLARLGPETTFTWSATQQFADVPPTIGASTNPFFKYVQKLAEMGITAGCTAATSTSLADYCPNGVVTRDQMAVFLVVGGFNLLTPSAPIISSVSPNFGAPPSQTVTITGVNTHFDATNNPTTTTILPIAGITASTPVVTSPTSLTVTLTIPPGTPAGPISITAETPLVANGCVTFASSTCEDATAPNGFAVGTGDPVPTITSFTPASGPIGTSVTITGTTLVSSLGVPATILVPLQGGGKALTAAPVATATATSLTFVVPSTAATGTITVSGSSGSVTSMTPFTVVPSSTYTISAAPSLGSVIAGQSTTYTVNLATSSGFVGMATLSLSGLPAGLTATFNPAAISVGQQSVLTITAPANQTTTTATLTINGSATVDGLPVPAATTAMLNVMPITTSFIGRTVVDNSPNTSLVGVTVTMLGQNGAGQATGCTGSTVSDGSGNFALTNLPSACLGPQLVGFSGLTVTSPPGTYAGLQLVFTLVANTVLVSPALVNLPQINTAETFNVIQNDTVDQTYSYSTIPGLSVTVYAGTVFTEQDGSQPNPFPLAAVQVPVDRLPDPVAPTTAAVVPFIVAFQPAESNASKPVAVWFPNSLNTPPGTDMPLMTLDPTLGRMVPYGTGTVSDDGTTIIPDIDPSTGTLQHRYGIVHFDWHGFAAALASLFNLICGCGPSAGGPVDLSSGVDVLTSTDMILNGNRGSISIERTYRTLSSQLRAFGLGNSFNYDYRLDTETPQSVAVVNVEFPNGTLVPFARQADGTLINQTVPILLGAVLTTAADGTAMLRFKNGSYFTFAPGFKLAPSVLTSVGDPNGNVTTIIRDPSDPRQITEIDDPVGRKLTFTWNSIPTVASITDPIGRVVRYTYNTGNDTLATFTNVLGGVTKYTYDSQNRLLTVTDPRGVVTETNTYDPNGRVATQANSAGGTFKFVAAPSAPIADAYLLLNPLIPSSPVLQATYQDPLGNPTTYRFNAQGYVIGATDATGQTRTINRASGTNLILSMTGPGTCPLCGDPRAGDVSFTYDSSGNLQTRTDALGDTTTFTWDPVFNKLTSATDALGNVARLSYDSRGNLIGVTDPNGNSTTITRDANGLITSVEDASANTTSLTNDSLVGDLVAATNPLSQKTQFSYDGASRLSAVMDPLAQTSSVAFNSGGEATSLVEGNGRTTQISYDVGGFLASFTDPNGNQTQLTYDTAGRVSSKIDPLKRTTSYRYDLNNNLIGFTNRRGQVATFAYDALNRLISETYADATVQRSYDSAGRLTRVVDSQSGTFDMTYDAAGRLIKTVGPNGTVSYTRDADGRISSRQVVGQPAVNYAYDANGNMIGATMGSVSVTRTYDQRNLLISNTRSNGVTGTYSYDPIGRVITMTEQSGGGTVFSRAFTYGAAGDLTGDSMDTGVALAKPSATGIFDAANEIISFGGSTYTNDADGNRLAETSASGKISYTWDARGRLEAISAPGGVTTTFLYDYAGNMIQKRVVSPGNDDIQQYVLDDLSNIVSVQDGATITSILDGRGPDDVIAIVKGGSPVFPLLDQISSNSALTDGSGNVVGREFYETFGGSTTSGTASLFGFTGQLQINSGLYYYRSRFYDANTGRFLSEDTFGLFGGDINFYRYVRNAPISGSDPGGTAEPGATYTTQEKWVIVGGTIATVGGGLAVYGSCFVPYVGWAACAGAAISTLGAGVGTGAVIFNPTGPANPQAPAPESDSSTPSSACPVKGDPYAPFGPLNPSTPFGVNNPDTPFGPMNTRPITVIPIPPGLSGGDQSNSTPSAVYSYAGIRG